MGLISSTSPVWTPATGTAGQGSGTITTEFYDNSGQNFKLTHSGQRYQGIRLVSPNHRNFKMSFQWKGSYSAGNPCAYFGPFWGNTHNNDIWGGSSTGLKAISFPNTADTFSWRLRDNNSNTDRFANGRINTADQNDDSTWHTTVIEVKGKCCRIWHNGTDAMTAGFGQYGGTTYSDQMNQAGYIGLMLYMGQVEVRNFTVVDLPENSTEWEHMLTLAPTASVSDYVFNNIFDQGYTRIKMTAQYLSGLTEQTQLRFRILNESNNAYTNNYYASAANVIGTESNNAGANWYTGYTSYGQFWDGLWASSLGGIHGEIIIDNFTLSHAVMNNTMSRQGVYSNQNRVIARFDFVGYKNSSNSSYTRQSGIMRYNSALSPSSLGGFQIYPASGSWARDPELNLYGMRSPAY